MTTNLLNPLVAIQGYKIDRAPLLRLFQAPNHLPLLRLPKHRKVKEVGAKFEVP